MKISYNWLKQYIDLNLPAERTGELLTDCGLEVEGIEEVQSIKGGLEGLVIGEVLTCEKHPNADKLSVTTVNVGNDSNLNIVCGAPNVAAGQKVVVATVGTTLYTPEGDSFKIKKGKIRGEVSEGMICAEDEIGLGNSHDGIMVLDSSATVGTPAASYFNIESDFVFEIGLTPNRADATSHIGTARDFKALSIMHDDVNVKQINWPSVHDFKIDNEDLKIEVKVEDYEACPRYAGVTLTGVKVEESPEWLQNRLKAIGLAPINNVVDITNYVLHEVGQPLHAFDADKIKGNKVVVKTLPEGTPFKTLDEQERKLNEKDLMICNESEGMCIAGVFGGIESGVSEQTQSIFLESAYFNPVSVRKTAKRHALNTDASFRFERGIDPNITVYALKRAAMLIKEIAGGSISSEIIDLYPQPIEDFTVKFNYNNCDRIIGESIDRSIIKQIITQLEIEITEESDDFLMLNVPAFKVDVQREIDVIEEVLRIYGYNKIEIPEKVHSSLAFADKPDKEKIQNTIANIFSANGFHEMMANSLTKSSYYNENPTWPVENSIEIKNPLSSELDVLRQSLVYNALEAIAYNQNRRNEDLKMFEFGKTYSKLNGESHEEKHLSMVITGKFNKESWNTGDENANFYHLKGYLHQMLEKLGLSNFALRWSESELAIYSYGLDLKINNKSALSIGRISDDLMKDFDIRNEVFYADINWDVIIDLVKNTKIKYKPISKYQAMRRDFAMLIDTNVKFEQIEQIARKTEKKLLREINLFDVYQGKNLEAGKKSYAVSFTFKDDNKTLTDVQVDKIMNKLLKQFETQVGATLR